MTDNNQKVQEETQFPEQQEKVTVAIPQDIPKPNQMSLSIAELLEVYIQEKAKIVAQELAGELEAKVKVLSRQLQEARGTQEKVLTFAEKLATRHASVPDNVLEKYLSYFDLHVRADKQEKQATIQQ